MCLKLDICYQAFEHDKAGTPDPASTGSLLPEKTAFDVAKGLLRALLMALDSGVIVGLRIRSLQCLDALRSRHERLRQRRVLLDQLGRGPFDTELLQHKGRDMRSGEKNPGHTVAVEPCRHDVPRAIGHGADKGERVDAGGLHAGPVASLLSLECQFCLVLFPRPVNYVGLWPGLIVFRNSRQELMFVVTLDPVVRIVSNYGFRATDDDCIVRWRQLDVVVVDICVVVLCSCMLDESLWSRDGTNGAETWEDQIGEFWKQMRSPAILQCPWLAPTAFHGGR